MCLPYFLRISKRKLIYDKGKWAMFVSIKDAMIRGNDLGILLVTFLSHSENPNVAEGANQRFAITQKSNANNKHAEDWSVCR